MTGGVYNRIPLTALEFMQLSMPIAFNRFDISLSGVIAAIEECDLVAPSERCCHQMPSKKACAADDQKLHCSLPTLEPQHVQLVVFIMTKRSASVLQPLLRLRRLVVLRVQPTCCCIAKEIELVLVLVSAGINVRD